jgi:TonB family protein
MLLSNDVRSAAEPTPFPPIGSAPVFFSFMPPPGYPKIAQYHRQQGKGWFELTIDFSTGRVQQVKVLKSTGWKLLDDSAVATFLQWRAKPRTIYHAVLPMEFKVVFSVTSRSNQTMQPTASPRTAQFCMINTHSLQASLAAISGG